MCDDESLGLHDSLLPTGEHSDEYSPLPLNDESSDINNLEENITSQSDYIHRQYPLFSFDQQNNLQVHNFYITMPWSPQVYFTVRGAENFHIYLWIAKDLSWTRDAYMPAMVFGVASLSWCLVLMFHAISAKCITEVYMLIVMIMWIAANFLWMSGEVFRGDDDVVLEPTSYVMEAAIGLVIVYHIILRPLRVIPRDDLMNAKYEDADLTPRFSYFRNWREYEHFHTLCWLGKDLSWNRCNIFTWSICFIPTFMIAIDFMWCSFKTKKMAIDFAHYAAMFIWVIASAVWGAGNIIFLPYVSGYTDDWTTYPITSPSHNGIRTCRWWASIVLICAYIPIVCLYILWLPLTCSGRIRAADIPENFVSKRPSYSSFSVHVKKKKSFKKRFLSKVGYT